MLAQQTFFFRVAEALLSHAQFDDVNMDSETSYDLFTLSSVQNESVVYDNRTTVESALHTETALNAHEVRNRF